MTSLNSELIAQWKDQEDGSLVLNCLEYLDVVSLIKKKPISRGWKKLCTTVIDNKCGDDKKKPFQSTNELYVAVDKYSPGFYDDNEKTQQCTPTNAEEIASTYGYPINKWDVSNITDFSYVFQNKSLFNEPIGSWDVSKATTMDYMFIDASSFNQDLSSWNVSNVTSMFYMFFAALSFNQNVSSWNVSNVTDMRSMFANARSFNQDISSWNVSNVDVTRMFYNCPVNARQLP